MKLALYLDGDVWFLEIAWMRPVVVSKVDLVAAVPVEVSSNLSISVVLITSDSDTLFVVTAGVGGGGVAVVEGLGGLKVMYLLGGVIVVVCCVFLLAYLEDSGRKYWFLITG